MSPEVELSTSFPCFGSTCEAFVTGSGPAGSAGEAVAMVERELLAWHGRFSRFLPQSELSALNEDARELVPVTPMMVRLAHAVATSGSTSGGLVDATMLDQIERAGYAADLPTPLPLAAALKLAPARRAAAPAPAGGWRRIEVDLARGLVRRPPSVKVDSGGVAKGLFADVLAERLAGHAGFAINCAGDITVGGSRGLTRAIRVQSPFDGGILHALELRHGAVATSGIGRRSWLDAGGRPAHHLLDPSTGRPAFTGIVQVTALAPTALAAEVKAKAALLSGPRLARRWLSHGGVIVFDDGTHEVLEPPAVVTLGQLSGFRNGSRTRVLEGA
ncbi:MAG TPA: FAD:protein FMN transferase [Solirubrobacteraceae bacterium]|jgi:thiamine biosynthesis lipoprotein|nr:FAD:protein FMN transferase [Solirubrobacteraceae bacterium]